MAVNIACNRCQGILNEDITLDNILGYGDSEKYHIEFYGSEGENGAMIYSKVDLYRELGQIVATDFHPDDVQVKFHGNRKISLLSEITENITESINKVTVSQMGGMVRFGVDLGE